MILRVIGVAGTSKEVEGGRKLRDSNRKNLESGVREIDILPLNYLANFSNPMIFLFL